MMDYSSLLKNNRITVGRFSQKQIHGCLDLAARDVKTARKIVMEDPDWGYTIAYNAMLQAARALMFSEGYRATGEAQHATVIQFAQISLGGEFNSTVQLMDVMRRKRHRAVYDIAGLVLTGHLIFPRYWPTIFPTLRICQGGALVKNVVSFLAESDCRTRQNRVANKIPHPDKPLPTPFLRDHSSCLLKHSRSHCRSFRPAVSYHPAADLSAGMTRLSS